MDELQLNVSLLKRRVPNLTVAAKDVGLRPATVSNLCTGKIPIGRAEVRTLAALASLAGCTLDELIIRNKMEGMIETGIRVVDIFAPVMRGGTIGCVARPMMGQFVLLAELVHRFKTLHFTTVFWAPSEQGVGVDDVEKQSEFTGYGVDEIYSFIRKSGMNQDVFIAADRSAVMSGEMLHLRDRLRQLEMRPATVVIVDMHGESVDEEAPYGPLDSSWRLDMDLVARNLYPAISPVLSTSTLVEEDALSDLHLAVQQRARKHLRRYRELRSIVNLHGLERLSDAEQRVYRMGERIELFLSQPFYVAEKFTKKRGEWSPLEQTLHGMLQILDGHNESSPEI